MNKKYITHLEVIRACITIADTIEKGYQAVTNDPMTILLYAVPRGGSPIALVVDAFITSDDTFPMNIQTTDDPSRADYIIDDLVDSGKTKAHYEANYTGVFLAAFEKENNADWYVFPWEAESGSSDSSADDIVIRLLQFIGEDPSRGGLAETPKRVLKAWQAWTSGYSKDAKSILKVFEDGADNYDEMVIVKDIPFYSHCEHHLAPFFGTVTIAYIPNGKIVGLSKLSRLVEMYARRLQVQERMTTQIAGALQDHLKPLGVGVIVKARHLCMESRGICQQGHHTMTSAVVGVLKENQSARQEFLALA